MNIKQCVASICKSAEKYNENLANKNLLFIFQEKPNKIGVMETVFRESNFMHLTGVEFVHGKEMSPTDFYSSAINSRLKIDVIKMRSDGTTEQKLQILPTLLEPNLSAKMIGIYRGGRVRLVTERLAGGLTGAIGFVENQGRYYPNTILKGDIRDSIEKPLRVLAVFRKSIDAERYEGAHIWLRKLSCAIF